MSCAEEAISLAAIIPTYNRANLVARAIQSALDQTSPLDEIIIVDDGSTDKTPQTLSEYGERITVVSQSNQGLSRARNAGVAAATADWVLFLDDDDVWEGDWAGAARSAIASFGGRQVVGVVGNADYVAADGSVVGTAYEQAGVSFDTPRFANKADSLGLLSRCATASAVALSRPVWEACRGFRPQLEWGEDVDLWLRSVAHGPWVFLPQTAVSIRQPDNDSSRLSDLYQTNPERTAQIRAISLAELMVTLPDRSQEFRVASQLLGQWMFRIDDLRLERGDRVGVRLRCLAFFCHPKLSSLGRLLFGIILRRQGPKLWFRFRELIR